MKTVKRLIDTLSSMPEAERVQAMDQLITEAAASLSPEEYDELLSDIEADAATALALATRMRHRGPQPAQTAAEVLTKEDFLEAHLARLQQQSDSK